MDHDFGPMITRINITLDFKYSKKHLFGINLKVNTIITLKILGGV